MSALGQKQTCAAQKVMSALPPKADMCSATWDVRSSGLVSYLLSVLVRTPDQMQLANVVTIPCE